MAPTILSLAGLPIPKNMDGVSLVAELRQPHAVKRESLSLMNFWGNSEIRELAVVTREWKYVFWSFESQQMRPTEELFHVGKDRLEMKNLVGDAKYADRLQTMRALYDKHFQHLKANVVDFHGYRKYRILFDRKATREQKAPLLKSPLKKKKRRKCAAA